MLARLTQISLSVAFATCFSSAAFAENIAAPSGAPVLTISGELNTTNVADTLVLDREALAALPVTSFETSTIWTDGAHTFQGVSLHDLAALVGATEGAFMATAINDYSVEIPMEDAVDGGPIVAYLMDGEEMSVREKGPLWVIYPYDSKADYRTEVIYSRSIWQLDRLEVVK